MAPIRSRSSAGRSVSISPSRNESGSWRRLPANGSDRFPQQNSRKWTEGDELEMDRPKIPRRTLRTLDIALAESLVTYPQHGCRKASNPHCSENVSMMPATSC